MWLLATQKYFLGVWMDSGPLIPVNGQVLREVQADHPIELNRQLGPSALQLYPGRTPPCANTCVS